MTSSILAQTEGHFFDFLDGCIFTYKEWSDVHNLSETSPAYSNIGKKKWLFLKKNYSRTVEMFSVYIFIPWLT